MKKELNLTELRLKSFCTKAAEEIRGGLPTTGVGTIVWPC